MKNLFFHCMKNIAMRIFACNNFLANLRLDFEQWNKEKMATVPNYFHCFIVFYFRCELRNHPNLRNKDLHPKWPSPLLEISGDTQRNIVTLRNVTGLRFSQQQCSFFFISKKRYSVTSLFLINVTLLPLLEIWCVNHGCHTMSYYLFILFLLLSS